MSAAMPTTAVTQTDPLPATNPFTERWAATSPSDTKEEALAKERAFQDAQKVSREIDELLLESKKTLDKKKNAAQILLLGTYTTFLTMFWSNPNAFGDVKDNPSRGRHVSQILVSIPVMS